MHPEVLDQQNRNIFFKLKAFPGFYLAGGTALALQIGHRKSVDFDLFSEKEISNKIFAKVNKVFADKTITPSVNNLDELTVFVSDLKITFLKYPFAVISDLIIYEEVGLLSVKEIAAAKAYTIGRRGSFKDYIDLYFIISEGHSSLKEIIEISEKKYGKEFHARLFLEQLIYLEDIEEENIVFLKKEVRKEEVKKFLEEKVRELPI